jgi:5-methylcytosine-specific restriction endonuclease McrA
MVSMSNSEAVARRRKVVKQKAVELLGGKCSRCGYSKCLRALQFHHVDPATKLFGIAEKGVTRAWYKVVEELKKCVLLCANCHAEEEEFLLGISKTGIAVHC